MNRSKYLRVISCDGEFQLQCPVRTSARLALVERPEVIPKASWLFRASPLYTSAALDLTFGPPRMDR
jgi:hypothetical protein